MNVVLYAKKAARQLRKIDTPDSVAIRTKKTIRKSSRQRIAAALGLHESQFDF